MHAAVTSAESPMRTASALSVLLAVAACGGDTRGPLDEVEALVFLQRQARNDGLGNVFAYESYVPGARVYKLSPPAADGDLTVLCCDQFAEFAAADVIAYDLSFDARELVISAKLSADSHYGLFLYRLESNEIDQLPTDPNFDYVYPTYLPGDRILFATNAVVEEGAPQHRDEYERAVTLQLGSIGRDGSNLRLFSRNLSHRTTSTVLSSGEVLFTQWQHLTDQNDGHLLRMNPDGTRVRESFGSEGTGVTNSYYKPVEISPGRILAIGSSRDMTFQSGTILDIRLGRAYEEGGKVLADRDESEVTASVRILTEGVPLGEEPSFPTVGRYYSAWPLDAGELPNLVVSWADGPVQSDINGAAGVPPDFGLYLYDSARRQRRPIFDAAGTWEIAARPLAPRPAPPTIPATGSHRFGDAVLIGNMNVYDSSVAEFSPGSIYGVRVVEGFSGEEGVGMDFGLTEAEGAASLGIAPVREDGSWLGLIPANVPVHQIVIDRYGMALKQETVWISGNPGESRVCGGCHESRTGTTVIDPGITDAIAFGPTDLMSQVGRFDRVTTDPASPVGIPWDGPIQAIFDAKCVQCHEGTPGAANPSYTVTDPDSGQSQTFVFDLRGGLVTIAVGEAMISSYSISHLSLIGPSMLLREDRNLEITGQVPSYVVPHDSRSSTLIQRINPRRQFPTVSDADRAFGPATHPADVGRADLALTAAEERLLVEMVDNGGQFFSRENAPGLQ
jgi:hypothetical protein